MDARFSQVFSRNKISGKYLDINHNLVKDLKNMGIWDEVKEDIIESQGDISNMTKIPQHIRDIYKTSFTTSPLAYVEVAARAQKWVDQAISRNMYLETRDIDETMKIYTIAWRKGLKSTYYLHMKPRHTAEQSTVRVNKAEAMGKRGFAALRDMRSTEAPKAPITEPIESGQVITVAMRETVTVESLLAHDGPVDPQAPLVCDSCQ
jgi:ribonucleoside-diphosphate reductase alpha chain